MSAAMQAPEGICAVCETEPWGDMEECLECHRYFCSACEAAWDELMCIECETKEEE